jgi:hypothetical protein
VVSLLLSLGKHTTIGYASLLQALISFMFAMLCSQEPIKMIKAETMLLLSLYGNEGSTQAWVYGLVIALVPYANNNHQQLQVTLVLFTTIDQPLLC